MDKEKEIPLQALGTCGICGGLVVVPSIWYGNVAPMPECLNCASKPKKRSWAYNNLPEIEME